MGSSYIWCNSKEFIFSKPLDLSGSNGKKKKKHINGNILIRILLIILYLFYSIPISKPNKKVYLSLSLSLSLLHYTFLSVSFFSTALPPPMARLPVERKEKKKKAIAASCTTRISNHHTLLGPWVYSKGTDNFTYFVVY